MFYRQEVDVLLPESLPFPIFIARFSFFPFPLVLVGEMAVSAKRRICFLFVILVRKDMVFPFKIVSLPSVNVNEALK